MANYETTNPTRRVDHESELKSQAATLLFGRFGLSVSARLSVCYVTFECAAEQSVLNQLPI